MMYNSRSPTLPTTNENAMMIESEHFKASFNVAPSATTPFVRLSEGVRPTL